MTVPYVLPPGATALETIEQLGAYMAGRYQAVEAYLLERIAYRVRQDMTTDDLARRVRALQLLQAETAQALAEVRTEQTARAIIAVATEQGEAAAIEALGVGRALGIESTAPAVGPTGQPLPFATGLVQANAAASAQIGLELTTSLTAVNSRILRAVPDLYQQTVARFTGARLLGGTTGRELRTRTVAAFLQQGLTGFTDAAGRAWSIGGYTNMATRTATNRAWISAMQQRYTASGLNLVTIVRGVDSCKPCAEWSGKVLSTDGTVGTVTLRHATEDRDLQVTIAGTVDQARAAGWNHPNCRCTLAPVFPGLSLPANLSTYNPQAEADRDRLRYLERRVRTAKLSESVAKGLGDDVAAARYRRAVRAEQSRIREHVARTGQVRKPYREQIAYQVGKPLNLPKPDPLA